MDASTSISLINKICFCLNVSADGTKMKTPVREGSKDEKNPFYINKQACKYSVFIISSLHLLPAHTDKVLNLQHKCDVIYELDAAPRVDALRSYLTLLQRAGLVSFKKKREAL